MKCDYWSGRLYPVINQIKIGRSSLFYFSIGIPELCPVADCDSCYDKFSFTDCCELELVGKDALGDSHNLGIGYPDVVAIDGGCRWGGDDREDSGFAELPFGRVIIDLQGDSLKSAIVGHFQRPGVARSQG